MATTSYGDTLLTPGQLNRLFADLSDIEVDGVSLWHMEWFITQDSMLHIIVDFKVEDMHHKKLFRLTKEDRLHERSDVILSKIVDWVEATFTELLRGKGSIIG